MIRLNTEYSPAAKNDLLLIHRQIEEKFGVKVSKDVLRRITAQIRRLEQFPLSGVYLGEEIHSITDYRYIFVEKNYVFYRFERESIKIIRVLNQKQNYIYHLNNVDATEPSRND